MSIADRDVIATLRSRNRIAAIVANTRQHELDTFLASLFEAVGVSSLDELAALGEDVVPPGASRVDIRFTLSALSQIVAALAGEQDPHRLGVADNPMACAQVKVISEAAAPK